VTTLHIYILGVKARFRGENLIEAIKGSGHTFEIVWGEDAQNRPRTLSFLARSLSRIYNKREISVGEYCCFMGHQRILSNFLASGNEWALILEEDATLMKDISLIARLTEGKNGPTILHLAGIDFILSSSKEETFWVRGIEVEYQNDVEIILYRVIGNVFGAFGFLINREAAKIAVKGNSRLKFPQTSDWPSTWRYKVKFLLTDLCFVSVETAGSELEKSRNLLLETSAKSKKNSILMKIRGWFGLMRNLTLIEPLFKSLLGVSLRSVLYENVYLYLYSRLLLRLRRSSSLNSPE
jgi:hypothetical protein